jgi:tetratricopeptide (TPR) repeat protein/TolB-like protein
VGVTVMDQTERLRAALADRYELDREVGSGGMAHVYRAHDRQHDRDVAIKVLKPELAAALGTERFLREIHIAARLQHPHILPLYDSGVADGFLYYVMPYVEGETLRDLIRREKQLSLGNAIQIARDVAEALSYAHTHDVLHRDIKPANILLSGEHAVVADFGIAKAISAADEEALTGTGIAIGTPEYMSPEQGSGEQGADRRSDIYALGCVLYEMLAGQPPFTGRTAQSILARHRHDAPPSLRVVRPALPPEIEQAVETALAKVPADRFDTAQEFAEALAGATQSGTRTASRETRPGRGRITAAAAALTALAVGGIWWTVHTPDGAADPYKVMVFPLVDHAADRGRTGAGEEVAIMIGSALEHTEPLKWIDGWSSLNSTQRSDTRLLTTQAAREISRSRGARYYIDGSIVRAGDSATIVLRLNDAQGDSVVTQKSSTGPSTGAGVAELGLRAAVGLLPALVDPGRSSAGATLAAFADRHPAAIANWLQGEREYRRSQFVGALRYFRRAVEADSNLAVAALRGAESASWAERWDEAPALVELALRHRDYLPKRYQDFGSGLRAYYSGEADSAVAYFSAALAADSSWSEAWMALGETFSHLLPRTAGPVDSLTEAAFEAARRSDTTFTPPLFHLAEINLRRGEVEQSAILIRSFGSTNPDSFYTLQLGMMLRCAQGDTARSHWNALLPDHAMEALQAARWLSASAAYPACAADGFRSLLFSTAAPASVRYAAVIGLQNLLVALGRPQEAQAVLDSAVAGGIPAAKGLFVLDAAAGAGMEERAASVIAELAAPYDSMSGARLWYHGLWAYHQRRLDRLTQITEALTKVAAHSGSRSDYLLFEIMSGYQALLRGDTTEVIRRFTGLAPVAAQADLSWGLWESLGDVRITLARLLLAGGRAREAYDVARIFDGPQSLVFVLYLPASLELRAQAAELLGDRNLAASNRQRLALLARSGNRQSVSAREQLTTPKR